MLLWAVLLSAAAAQSEGGFLLGMLPGDRESVVRALGYGGRASSAPSVVLDAGDSNVTGSWVDFESQTLFVSTRNGDGVGNILRVGYDPAASRAIYWYGGSVAGVIWGLTGAHVLRSPSVFWVWQPTGAASPPYTGRPTLYRMPLLGGMPEVVTLHAKLCEQMSIAGEALYCSANGTMFWFDLTRPNSAFLPLALPDAVARDKAQGFVASREGVLFVLGLSGRLHRVESANVSQTTPWPSAVLSRTFFCPGSYNAPTDRLALISANETALFWIGMESFWRDAVAGTTSRAVAVSPNSTLGLRVVAFSASLVARVSWLVVAAALALCM